MSTPAYDNLVLAMAELVQTEAGQRFVEALKPFVEQSREELVMAPPEFLHYAQGVARQGTALVKMFASAKTEAEKIIIARQSKRSST
jgi:hypothetical protein